MFYAQSVTCRYVDVMSGTVRSVEKLCVKNLEDSRIKRKEVIAPMLEARTQEQKARTETKVPTGCKNFRQEGPVIQDSTAERYRLELVLLQTLNQVSPDDNSLFKFILRKVVGHLIEKQEN